MCVRSGGGGDGGVSGQAVMVAHSSAFDARHIQPVFASVTCIEVVAMTADCFRM